MPTPAIITVIVIGLITIIGRKLLDMPAKMTKPGLIVFIFILGITAFGVNACSNISVNIFGRNAFCRQFIPLPVLLLLRRGNSYISLYHRLTTFCRLCDIRHIISQHTLSHITALSDYYPIKQLK